MGRGVFLLVAFFLEGCIAVEYKDVEFREGGNATISCSVAVQEESQIRYKVKWFKDEAELKDLQRQQPVFTGHGREFVEDDFDTSEGSGNCEGEDCDDNKLLLIDNSLQITGMKPGDIGEYKCEAVVADKDSVDGVITPSKVTRIYRPVPFPWWIIVVVIIVLILLVGGGLFYLKYKKGWNVKGYYDVKDIEDTGARSDKSDVYYKADKVDNDSKITYNQQESTLEEE